MTRRDLFTNTPEDAAAFERHYADEDYDDGAPTRAEAEADEAAMRHSAPPEPPTAGDLGHQLLAAQLRTLAVTDFAAAAHRAGLSTDVPDHGFTIDGCAYGVVRLGLAVTHPFVAYLSSRPGWETTTRDGVTYARPTTGRTTL